MTSRFSFVSVRNSRSKSSIVMAFSPRHGQSGGTLREPGQCVAKRFKIGLRRADAPRKWQKYPDVFAASAARPGGAAAHSSRGADQRALITMLSPSGAMLIDSSQLRANKPV